MVALQNVFESFLSSATFWKSLSMMAISSSLNFCQNSPVRQSGPVLLFVGRFSIRVSVSELVTDLFIFPISSWYSFRRLYFSQNLSISSKLSILLAYSCLQQSLKIFFFFYFCPVCYNFSLFISNSIALSPHHFFFNAFSYWFVYFIFSKNQLLVLSLYSFLHSLLLNQPGF